MRKIALAVAAVFAATPAFADNTDTQNVTVNGTIIAPLTITATTALTMPHVVLPKSALSNAAASPSTGTSTVSITCTTSTTPTAVTYGAGANPYAAGVATNTTVQAASANKLAPLGNFTGTCASVTVTGQSGYFFLPATGSGSIAITLPPGVTGTAACPTASTVLTGGTATLYCGASVSVTTAAAAGAYTGSFPVTVTYD